MCHTCLQCSYLPLRFSFLYITTGSLGHAQHLMISWSCQIYSTAFLKWILVVYMIKWAEEVSAERRKSTIYHNTSNANHLRIYILSQFFLFSELDKQVCKTDWIDLHSLTKSVSQSVKQTASPTEINYHLNRFWEIQSSAVNGCRQNESQNEQLIKSSQ